MAPPSPRRPGFSKRAQYSLFGGYVIAVGGIAFAGLLLVTAQLDPEGHAAIQQGVADVFSPVSSGARAAIGGMGSAGDAVLAYVDAGSKNRAMKAELEAARTKLIEGEAAKLENRRLKRLLKLEQRFDQPVARARLVSSTGSNARRYATLDAGTVHGVRNGLPVIGPEGLVGRIAQAGRVSSRVLLIVDAGNVVPVMRVSDGTPALANGMGDGRLELRSLAGGGVAIKPRDVFVTSGTGGVYRPGVPVAMALRTTRDGAIGRPLADPARFDFAIVAPEYMPAPPPVPQPEAR
jgi:rod shape-determining protein MreC